MYDSLLLNSDGEDSSVDKYDLPPTFEPYIFLISTNRRFVFPPQVWDATAADPKLLVFLKSYRNTVPVPRHWCQKRKFLQVSDDLDARKVGN